MQFTDSKFCGILKEENRIGRKEGLQTTETQRPQRITTCERLIPGTATGRESFHQFVFPLCPRCLCGSDSSFISFRHFDEGEVGRTEVTHGWRGDPSDKPWCANLKRLHDGRVKSPVVRVSSVFCPWLLVVSFFDLAGWTNFRQSRCLRDKSDFYGGR